MRRRRRKYRPPCPNGRKRYRNAKGNYVCPRRRRRRRSRR